MTLITFVTTEQLEICLAKIIDAAGRFKAVHYDIDLVFPQSRPEQALG